MKRYGRRWLMQVGVVLCLSGSGLWSAVGVSNQYLEVGPFSTAQPGDGLPPEWRPLLFKNIATHTAYTLVQEAGTVVIQAHSEAAASGLIRPMSIDPQRYPIVQWRWKVTAMPGTSDVREKQRDDAPARLYITFASDPKKQSLFEKAPLAMLRLLYGEEPPHGALLYVWERQMAAGTVVVSPYTAQARLLVVQSGSEPMHTWHTYERNVLADYQRAFGSTAPLISGVGIMTDTDNTGETATAYYGDIVLKPAP